MHADGSGIQDGVKRLAAQRATRNDFAAGGFGQFSRSLFPPVTNSNESASFRKSERRNPRGAARSEDQVDGVHTTRDKPCIVQQRRKGMSHGIADDPVDPRTARESVRAVEILHVMKRNLAGGGSCGDGGVSQRASFAQSEDSSRKADFAHRSSDKIFRAACQAQEPDAVADGTRFGGNLHGIDASVSWRADGSWQILRAIKVVKRKHDARRHRIFPNGLAGKLAQGFHCHIAPLATCFASLNQPMEFVVNATIEFSTSFAAAARDEKRGIPKSIFL